LFVRKLNAIVRFFFSILVASEPSVTLPASSLVKKIYGDFDVEGAVRAAIAEVFTSGDITNAKNSFSFYYEMIGGNPIVVDTLFNGIKALVAVLTPKPNNAQKFQITERSQNLSVLSNDVVKSYPGLENFKNDPKLTVNPDNVDFYQTFGVIQKDVLAITTKPEIAFGYFNDPATAKTFARFIILINELAIRTSMLATSKYITHFF
jgi:hypothetical protein